MRRSGMRFQIPPAWIVILKKDGAILKCQKAIVFFISRFQKIFRGNHPSVQYDCHGKAHLKKKVHSRGDFFLQRGPERFNGLPRQT